MAMYSGNRKIVKVYRGNKEITSIYRGSRKVFSTEDFERMTYVYAPSLNAVIDLGGQLLDTSTDKFEIKIRLPNSLTKSLDFFGQGTRARFKFDAGYQCYRVYFGTLYSVKTADVPLNEIVTYTLDKDGFYKNGVKEADVNYEPYRIGQVLRVSFNPNANQVFYFKKYTNGELVHHFIPIKKNNQYGFHDLITGTEVFNANLIGVKE